MTPNGRIPLTLRGLLAFLHIGPMREVGRRARPWQPTIAQIAERFDAEVDAIARELDRLVDAELVRRIDGPLPAFQLLTPYPDVSALAEAKNLDVEEILTPVRREAMLVLAEHGLPFMLVDLSNADEARRQYANDVGRGDLVITVPRTMTCVVIYRGWFYPAPWRAVIVELGKKGIMDVGRAAITKRELTYRSDAGTSIDLLAGRL